MKQYQSSKSQFGYARDFLKKSSEPTLAQISERDRKWNMRKAFNEKVADMYRQSDEFARYADRMSDCANFLNFILLPDEKKSSVRLELKNARFCRVAQCPVCNWRKSLMWRYRMHNILPVIQEENPGCRFIFLTLSVKNCQIDKLKNKMGRMNKAWGRFTKRQEFPAIGWVRTLEVTPGKEVDSDGNLRNDRGHPHFHCLLMVEGSYYHSDQYLEAEDWHRLWQESLRVSYDLSIDISSIEAEREPSSIVNEVVKYCTKASDKIRSKEWLFELTRQMHKRKTITTGGILKDYLKDLEKEDIDLIGHDDTKVEEKIIEGELYFTWRNREKEYIMKVFD